MPASVGPFPRHPLPVLGGRGPLSWVAAVAALGIGGAGLLVAAPASAEELSGVIVPSSIELTSPVSPIYQYDPVRVDADFDVPADAQAGDTFELTLPTELSPASGDSFPITLTDDPTVTIATCTAGVELVCTLDDYFGERGITPGSLYLQAEATGTTSLSSLRFVADGVPVDVPLPGGQIGIGVKPTPASTTKEGAQQSGDRMIWSIEIVGAEVEGVDPLVITDRLRGPADGDYSGQSYDADTGLLIHSEPAGGGAHSDVPDGLFVGDFDGSGGFTLTTTAPLDPDLVYFITYYTVADGPPAEGDRFSNTATVDGRDYSRLIEWRAEGGGSGEGAAAVPPAPSTPPVPTPSSPVVLAVTGGVSWSAGAIGVGLVVVGAGILALRRRTPSR